ncbi:MAG: MFS transporter, partial [Syntrophobacter sp.]
IIPFASATLGVGLIAFSHVRFFPLALFVLMATGFGMMVQLTSSNSVLQTVVEEDKRGRVMSLYTMGFMGTVPFGSLIYGALAHRIGAPNTLVLGGISCLIGAFLFARRISVIRDQVSPIYVKLGIIPEQPRLMGR